jgi:hypothetical protein
MLKYISICVFLPLFAFGQGEGKFWTEIGVKGAVSKKMDWGMEFNNRFDNRGLETFFPQLSIKYKVNKWFKPSIDYRAIVDRKKNGDYSFSNRLNFNATGKFVVNRFSISGRIRYQYAFGRLMSAAYDPEFDQAFRFKPEISYDINNSIFSPVASIEFFYDPSFHAYGRRFTKYRLFLGAELELDSPFDISIGYILDEKIQLPNPKTRHIVSLSVAYKFGEKKKK